jgi:hypothetical protein
VPQKFEKPFWKTIDGKEFASLKEAEAHEAANYHHALTGLDPAAVRLAIDLAPEHAALTAAIERAANEIKRNRRARAEAETSVLPPTQPDP